MNYLERVLTYLDSAPKPLAPDLLRELAVQELAQTAPEDDQTWVYDRYRGRLLDGRPLTDATDEKLMRDGLAALGWARTRALLNQHGWDGTDLAIQRCYSWGRPEWCGFADRVPVLPPHAPGVAPVRSPHTHAYPTDMGPRPDQPTLTESVAAPDGCDTTPYHPERRREAIRLLMNLSLKSWGALDKTPPTEQEVDVVFTRCEELLDQSVSVITCLYDELWPFAIECAAKPAQPEPFTKAA